MSADIVALLVALIALFGVLIAQAVLLRQSQQTDRRWRREETMRILRWASELAVDSDERKALLGLTTLDALDDSPLLDRDDQRLVSAVLETVLASGPDADDEYSEEQEVSDHGIE